MKIWLDDLLDDPDSPERHTPAGYTGAKTAWEAIELLKTGDVTEISLDHDLGDDKLFGTGVEVLKYIEEQVYFDKLTPPIMRIHSANPVGRRNMQQIINQIETIYSRKVSSSYP